MPQSNESETLRNETTSSTKSKQELLKLEPNLVVLLSVIAVPVIILGSLLILGTVRSEMNRIVGENLLGGAAEDTARHLDSHLVNAVTTVSIVSTSPALLEATLASNRGYRDSPEVIEERLKTVDLEWVRSRGAVPRALQIVGNEASEHLREIAEIHPTYKELLLTDRFGALVAATNITTDFYQADEEWWRDAFGDGDLGSLHFGDVTFDRSAGAYTLEISIPVLESIDEETTEVAGVLKALIGADELFSVVGSVRRGESGHALLVNSESGVVIAGRDVTDIMKREYPALTQLRETRDAGSRSFIAQQDGDVWLGAFAAMPQPSPAPFGHWVVVVQQLQDEVGAPVRRATTSLVIFFIVVALLVVGFSLYLHYKLVKPIREIDLREEMERLATS